MTYRLMGRLHAALIQGLARERKSLARERGQGTVEYVALILLVAVVLAGVVTATRKSKIGSGEIASTIVKKLKSAIGSIK